MAFDYKKLTGITTLAASAAAVFTNPSGKKSYIRLAVLHNTNTTTETVKLYCVPNNAGAVGTAATTNKFLEVGLAPNETLQLGFDIPGIILDGANDTLQGVSTTAAKVTFMVFGGQE